jgi:hypothetical protein
MSDRDGPTTRTPFLDLGDMCAMSFSTRRNGWCFHMEGQSQFLNGSAEYLGYCDATGSSGP